MRDPVDKLNDEEGSHSDKKKSRKKGQYIFYYRPIDKLGQLHLFWWMAQTQFLKSVKITLTCLTQKWLNLSLNGVH